MSETLEGERLEAPVGVTGRLFIYTGSSAVVLLTPVSVKGSTVTLTEAQVRPLIAELEGALRYLESQRNLWEE